MLHRSALTVVAVLLWAAGVAAQSTGYVQGGFVYAVQPAGVPNHRVSPPISGDTVGLSAGVGFFVNPRVAVEGEVVATRAVSTRQQFSYDRREDYIAQSRDLVLGVNVRGRPAPDRPFELVGGAGVTIATFANRSIVVAEPLAIPPRPPRTEPDQVTTTPQFAFHGGVAVPLRAGTRVELVPAFMVRWIARSQSGLGGYAGVGGLQYQAGASLRFALD